MKIKRIIILIITMISFLSCKNVKDNYKIKQYGIIPDSNENSLIKTIEIDSLKTFIEFEKKLQSILCNDSIPRFKIEGKNNEIKYIFPVNCCLDKLPCGTGLYRLKNVIEIQDEIIIKNHKEYKIDSLYQIMEKDYMNYGENPNLCYKPEKLVFFISYRKKNVNKLSKLLNTITNNFDKINIGKQLNIMIDYSENEVLQNNPPIPELEK